VIDPKEKGEGEEVEEAGGATTAIRPPNPKWKMGQQGLPSIGQGELGGDEGEWTTGSAAEEMGGVSE